MKRRQRLEKLSFEERVKLLRKGLLSEKEIADLAADVGSGNYIEARPDIEKLLDHANPIIRYNALGTLAFEWGLDSRADQIKEIAVQDADSDCRRCAAAALGSLFRGTNNPDVLKTLVSIARNPNEEQHVRAFAYTGSLDVLGVSREIQPNAYGLSVGRDELAALDEYLGRL
jgi:hypothetical protein